MPVFDWNQQIQNLPAAWRANEGQGVTIAILDSGLDPHPAFKNLPLTDCRYTLATGNYRPPIGSTPIPGNDDVRDARPGGVAHGTACLSVLAAQPVGTDGIKSIAPKARFLVIKTTSPDFNTYDDDLTTAIELAIRQGADIITTSVLPRATNDLTAGRIKAVFDLLDQQRVLLFTTLDSNTNHPVVFRNSATRYPNNQAGSIVVGRFSAGLLANAAAASAVHPNMDFLLPPVAVTSCTTQDYTTAECSCSLATSALAGVAALFIGQAGATGSATQRKTRQDVLAALKATPLSNPFNVTDLRTAAQSKLLKIFHQAVVVLAILCVSNGLAAQSLIQRALQLRAYIDTSARGTTSIFKQDSTADIAREIMNLLDPVLHTPPNSSFAQMSDSLVGNPFLAFEGQGALVEIPNQYQSLLHRSGGLGSSSVAPSSGGGFGVSAVADGIAKFLVARTKQELNIAFFEDFQKAILNDPRMTILFPATARRLAAIGDQVYVFEKYLTDLRQDFDKDLQILPSSLSTYVQTERVFKSPFRQILAEDALGFAQQLVDQTPPDSLIRYLASQTSVQLAYRRAEVDSSQRVVLTNLAAGWKTLALLSESMRAPAPVKGIWLKRSEVERALADPITLNIYLGLLWQQAAGVQFGDGSTLRDVLGNVEKAAAIRDCLRDFNRSALQVADALRSGQQSQARADESAAEGTAPTQYETFFAFSKGVLGLLESAATFKVEVAELVGESTRADSVVIGSLGHLNDLYFDTRQRLYVSAVNDLVMVLDLLLPRDSSFGKFRANVVKYGHFIATVAEADNSDGVAAAIEAVALPVGSARLKKETKQSLTVNAYTGLYAGSEQLLGSGFKSARASAGLTAPLGLAYNLGFKHQSLSLFVPIIDVGALVAFRFGDDTTEDLPAFKWSNLLAPGAYLVYGVKKYPIAIGLGAQRGPGLRKIDAVEAQFVGAWRIGAFVAVDIPVFSLFSRN